MDEAPARGLTRHLEGWETGAIIVTLALLAVMLFAPRRAVPHVLPTPLIDVEAQRREARADDELADRAELEPLPFEVRALGEYIRRYGASVAAADSMGAARAMEKLVARVPIARKHGDDALLQLRAVQTRLFLRALARWQATGESSEDLEQLAGDFLEQAGRNEWIRRGRLILGPHERAALFRIRWGQLTGLLKEPAFAPSANEWRVYYGALMRHPEGGPRSAGDAQRLKYVDALAKYDPAYPTGVVRGILSYRLGAYKNAIEAFRAHLSAHPAGPWNLRVQNYLAEAIARESETGTR